jgi:RES domain-containing protein
MALAAFVAAWEGRAYRHIPADSPYSVLDFRFAGQSPRNRWNAVGEPTLYLASDAAVALGELARHLDTSHPPGARHDPVARQVYTMQVQLDAAFDLRDARVWAELSLANAPHCFLDAGIARATAQFLRRTTSAQGIIVPSMAFLDQPDRWVLILFLEKLPADPGRFLHSVEFAGVFHVDA